MLPRKLIDIKTQKTFEVIKPYLKNRIIDIGAGNCLLAQTITNELKLDVQPIDIKNTNLTNLKVKIFDGQTIPFRNKFFDTSIMIFVLKYVEDKENFLKETRRVTKSRMIILEDAPLNTFEVIFKRLWDLFELKQLKFLVYKKPDEMKTFLTRKLHPKKIIFKRIKPLWSNFLNQYTYSLYVLDF